MKHNIFFKSLAKFAFMTFLALPMAGAQSADDFKFPGQQTLFSLQERCEMGPAANREMCYRDGVGWMVRELAVHNPVLLPEGCPIGRGVSSHAECFDKLLKPLYFTQQACESVEIPDRENCYRVGVNWLLQGLPIHSPILVPAFCLEMRGVESLTDCFYLVYKFVEVEFDSAQATAVNNRCARLPRNEAAQCYRSSFAEIANPVLRTLLGIR